MTKVEQGNFFEDFKLGQILEHATPRTVTEGDSALYLALTATRFAVNYSDPFARGLGLPRAPFDDMLAFHVAFGKTVPDISLNAIANLGYAGGVFGVPLYPGDTVTSTSEVIGIKENTNRETGVVYVRSKGVNQRGESVVDYCRWVMVRKRDADSPAPETVVPNLPDSVTVDQFRIPAGLDASRYDRKLAGCRWGFDDYSVGERIDHCGGMTIEEAEHAMATRLYQNTARVHFDQHVEKDGRFGRRIIYGGHIISLARAMTFNGLGNAFRVAALNGGKHVGPSFAGDTIYAWSEILAKEPLSGRTDLGALRIRTVAVKNQTCESFPEKRETSDPFAPGVVLDIDYWVLAPR